MDLWFHTSILLATRSYSVKQVLCRLILLKDFLDEYSAASGQLVNLEKSSVFFSKNSSAQCKAYVCSTLKGVKERKNSKSLGLPLVIGRSKSEIIFNYVVDTDKKRIGSWKNVFLSQAGKWVLIWTVVEELPVYVMSCFKLPTGIYNAICQEVANFWWGSNKSDSHKIHWKSWKIISIPTFAGHRRQTLESTITFWDLWEIWCWKYSQNAYQLNRVQRSFDLAFLIPWV